ncbi:MAG: hypothetical protein SFY81_14995, partial [Verrucomicrobiota bacterium]|nr:hypothetical protein [Verrucomicrobiota bacterium]
MSKRKRLRKLLQSQAAAASKAPLPPGNILSIPTPPTPLVTSGSKQKAVDLLWEMLHRKLQSPDAMTDLHFLTKSIEKMLRIELAHRKQDHAERKLLLAEKKQELAARKFAFQQLKQQEK